MMYGHQPIKQADACNNNLDDGISRLVRNGNFAKIIVVKKIFLSSWFFSTIHLYPHRNSTVDSTATVVAVAEEEVQFIITQEKYNTIIKLFIKYFTHD